LLQRAGGEDPLPLQEDEVALEGADQITVVAAHRQEADAHRFEGGGAVLEIGLVRELVVLQRPVLLRHHVVADARSPGRHGALLAGGQRQDGKAGDQENSTHGANLYTRRARLKPQPIGGMTQLAPCSANRRKLRLSAEISTRPGTSLSVWSPQRP